ncbi:hypothetical protein FH972_020908 [Carpinus fangiana]|uniref:Uncharacterized protein n=1 Tax=Carpinus fangiana TaxID=176857 RepID=A0A5N6RZ48_9ROSI|nr:hypothetical protein FH972_020908 [Carpinus fangiana]
MFFPVVFDVIEVFVGREYGGVVQWNTRRSLAEGSAGNSSLILAETRTYRKDPLDGFNRYSGGWNISNQHYWASVGLTAAPFFIIAGIWFVLFGLTLCIVCLRYCCCPREPFGYSRACYALSLILLIFFTLSAIAGCIVLYTGQGNFHSSTTSTLEYVVDQADTIYFPFLDCNLCLVMIGWILVAGTFILCGVFLLLHNVVADTCVAMDEWVQNPTAHTALDDILPCVDNATAQETLSQSKNVTYQLVVVVDRMIINISNVNFPPIAGPLYFNQSGPLMPVLCNPFYSNLADRQCATGEVHLNNATEVWKNYVCQVSASGICTTPGRLTPAFYNQMAAAVNVSYGLYRYAPFLVNLEDCTFVRDTFTGISNDHCPDLRRFSTWIYVGLVIVSAAVMFSLIFWVIYGRERRHRVYTKRQMHRSLDDENKGR